MIRGLLNWVSGWANRHWVEFFAGGAVLLLLIVVLWPLIVYTVPPGSVGVMWYRFFGGTVTTPGGQLREGLHVIFPWDKIYIYDARLQRIGESVKGLSVDGLEVSVNLSTRYVIDSSYAGFLHKNIGPNYSETLMRPQLRTLILTYISEHEASDLYSTRRDNIQSIVQGHFQSKLANISANAPFDDAYIHLEDVLIEEIRLPDFVRAAIEQKERVRHMSEAYDFRLRLEEKERQRKRIEAEGIRSFQEIVAPGITESYLRWRGIEATLQLSQSNNSKVIVIGGANGLPIILNTDTGQRSAGRQDGEDEPSKPGTPGGEPGGVPSVPPLGPRSELLQGPSLTGPAPLTASGSVLQQETMAPPGTPPAAPAAGQGAAAPMPHGPLAVTPEGLAAAEADAKERLKQWVDKLTGTGTAPAPGKPN